MSSPRRGPEGRGPGCPPPPSARAVGLRAGAGAWRTSWGGVGGCMLSTPGCAPGPPRPQACLVPEWLLSRCCGYPGREPSALTHPTWPHPPTTLHLNSSATPRSSQQPVPMMTQGTPEGRRPCLHRHPASCGLASPYLSATRRSQLTTCPESPGALLREPSLIWRDWVLRDVAHFTDEETEAEEQKNSPQSQNWSFARAETHS